MKKISLLVLLTSICLYIVYAPALQGSYAHHDQTKHFFQTLNPNPNISKEEIPQYKWFYKVGRPLIAEIEATITKSVSDERDLRKFRWLGFLWLVLCTVLLSLLLNRQGLSLFVSGALSIGIFILPGALNTIFMTSITNALTPLLALLAYAFMYAPWKRFNTLAFCVGFLILLLSFFGYAALSFMFLLPSFVSLFTLKRLDRGTSADLVRDLLIIATCSCLYYFIVKCYFWPLYPTLNVSSEYQVGISLATFFHKGYLLVTHIIPMAFNLWNIYTLSLFGAVLAGISLWVMGYQRALWVIAYFLCVNSIFLLTDSTLILFRIIMVSSSLALIIIFFAMVRVLNSVILRSKATKNLFESRFFAQFIPECINRGLRMTPNMIIAVFLLIVGMSMSAWNLKQNVINNEAELSYIREGLTLSVNRDINRIHIIQSLDQNHGFNGLPTIGDDFNQKTTKYTADMADLLKLAMKRSTGFSPKEIFNCALPVPGCMHFMPSNYLLLTSTPSPQDDIPFVDAQTLIIDMNKLSIKN